MWLEAFIAGLFYKILVFTNKKILTTTVSQFIKQICNTLIWLDKSVWNVQISGNPWQISTDFTATFHFTLQTVLINTQSMSSKKQISSLCKFCSIYEEIPEDFLYETDVDSYFYYKILDISQSHHRIVQVSKGSNKKSFAFKIFHFCDSKLQQRFILKEEVSISKKKLKLYSTVWVNFSKLLIKPTKYRIFLYPNLNLRLDLQKQKMNCLVIVTRI